MRAELARRGVEESVVESVLREAWDGGEAEAAGKVARAWLDRKAAGPGAGREPDKQRAALARHLGRKGFGGAAIHGVLASLDRLSGETAERTER